MFCCLPLERSRWHRGRLAGYLVPGQLLGSASPVAAARKPEPGHQPALYSASIHAERASTARAIRVRVVVVAGAFTDVLQGRSGSCWSIDA
jgi:hypothetical protein